jgi:hypothetical protein
MREDVHTLAKVSVIAGLTFGVINTFLTIKRTVTKLRTNKFYPNRPLTQKSMFAVYHVSVDGMLFGTVSGVIWPVTVSVFLLNNTKQEQCDNNDIIIDHIDNNLILDESDIEPDNRLYYNNGSNIVIDQDEPVETVDKYKDNYSATHDLFNLYMKLYNTHK